MLSYTVNGQSAALVTEQFALIADMPLEEATHLWEHLIAPGATLETILSELVRAGLTNLRDFVLAEFTDNGPGSVTVAVRGCGRALIDGAAIEAPGITTWHEHTSPRVTSLTLQLGDVAEGELTLLITQGIVRTNELSWGNEAPEEFSQTAIAVNAPEASGIAQAPPAPSHPQPAAPQLGHSAGWGEQVGEHTLVRRTIPRWMLRFHTGKVIGIGERVVVGRKPTPTITAGEKLETLLSPLREVSSNHALLLGAEDGVTLVDLGSTNGTVVTGEDGVSRVIRDGAEWVLVEGDTIDFGDGNVAECVRAAHPRL